MGKYLIGAHLSIAKGINSVQAQMDGLDMETCAFFLKSQRSFSFKPIEEPVIEKFKLEVKHPEYLLPHSSYLINLASSDDSLREKGKLILMDDLMRCEKLNIKYYNMHPGSNKEKNEGAKLLAKEIKDSLSKTKGVNILIENMSGQGNVLCNKFSEIKKVLDLINDDRVGVCLDTCHLFAYGYDIRKRESFYTIMEEFNKEIGVEKLKAMHLNDCKGDLGSKKDRHESIGKGKIGLEAFKFIFEEKMFRNIPLILETPDISLYKEEVRMLKSFIN